MEVQSITKQNNINNITTEELKKEIINNMHLFNNTSSTYSKEYLRLFYKSLRDEQWKIYKQKLLKTANTAMEYSINDNTINPENIKLEIKVINNNNDYSYLNDLYFFWNIFWWSTPYSQACGRQIRLLLWDVYHNAPFGLINLQSPVLNLGARDRYLKINTFSKDNMIYWINQSLYGQRIGALPPYNELLGSKMVALTLASKDIREIYENKYKSNGKVPIRLLFVTTTGAYGKSSVYDRLKIKTNNEYYEAFKLIGYTAGYGSCYIPETLYKKIKQYLNENHNDIIKRFSFNECSSPKLRLLKQVSRLLSLPDITFHNIKKGVYICEHVNNLSQVIHNNENPNWYNFSFEDLVTYWKERWCIPRSKRLDRWKYVNTKRTILEAIKTIEHM
jgi:hypothetical protein